MKISIRWALIAGFLGLIWGTHLITTTSSYLTSQEVLRQHARDIMKNIAELAMEQSQRHLLHAHGAAALTRRLLASNVVGSQTNQINLLERYLHDQLSVNPHFAGIYVGTPQGNFYDVRHFDAKAQGGFRTKVILNTPQEKQVRLIYRDPLFKQMSEETNNSDTYDPRNRPWYQKALTENRIVWTDPYIFYTSQKPGITIAGPFYDSSGKLMGVVGVDIEIDQLSIFIGNLKIGKHGKAFMLNRNSDVVAFGDLEKLKVKGTSEGGAARLAKIDELDDAHSRKAFVAAKIQTDASGMLIMDESRFARFTQEGQVYLAMFTPFSTPQWPWIIGVYLPEDDYLGAIKSNRFFNILVTMAISLFATFMGFLLARGVIRPIALLEHASRQIKMGHSTPLPQIHSAYSEIQETASAFAEMKTAVERSRKKYQGIFNNIQDVYYEASLKGTLIEISPSIEKISQYRRQELIGKTLLKIYADPGQRVGIVQQLIDQGRLNDREVVFRDKDGRIKHCSLNSMILRTRSGKPYRIIGSLRDINDRKTAEQELLQYKSQLEALIKERTLELQKANDGLVAQIERRRATEKQLGISEEKYRTILDTIEEAYFELDYSGTLTFVNEAACRIMGYTMDELSGMHFRHFSAHPSTREIIQAFRKMARSGEPVRVITYSVITKNGEKKVLDLSAALILNPSGIVSGFRGVARDVTAKIVAQKEKEKLQGQLNHAQRMEAVGTLAGGIAHDFNNLLMGIMGNISLIASKLDTGSQLSEYLGAIEQCVESGATLTRQLLGYARGGKYQVTPINLNETVQRTAEMFGRTKKEIQIHTRYQKGIWTVEADQGQIDQVLVNLYVNAWQAMAGDMTLSLSTKNVILDEVFTASSGAKPGPYVSISVQDRGNGIEPETLKRIFEPFFTTKKMGRGTGLGLASAFGIIKNHGGIIEVKSQVNQGSTFTIYLPAVSRSSEKVSVPVPDLPHNGSGTLLVVDDEPYILTALTGILQDLGYHVIPANSGHQAIGLFEREMDHIDGVLLDMIMPDLSGRQVLARLKKIRPGIKVLLSSGYSLDGMGTNGNEAVGDGFIQKPYHIEKLAATLDKVLNDRADPETA
ncbi:PAS domain S-box protein [uncultured Desulfosarcina sp.]|uniref:PAS domain S-box protein n=1 Tax=uncultured Desulfosarcina sp. TaxID=218289 RepID=UPI0029C82996|nr:PAS domain S-box protein [uncultured Desulfosarcina sp.]